MAGVKNSDTSRAPARDLTDRGQGKRPIAGACLHRSPLVMREVLIGSWARLLQGTTWAARAHEVALLLVPPQVEVHRILPEQRVAARVQRAAGPDLQRVDEFPADPAWRDDDLPLRVIAGSDEALLAEFDLLSLQARERVEGKGAFQRLDVVPVLFVAGAVGMLRELLPHLAPDADVELADDRAGRQEDPTPIYPIGVRWWRSHRELCGTRGAWRSKRLAADHRHAERVAERPQRLGGAANADLDGALRIQRAVLHRAAERTAVVVLVAEQLGAGVATGVEVHETERAAALSSPRTPDTAAPVPSAGSGPRERPRVETVRCGVGDAGQSCPAGRGRGA